MSIEKARFNRPQGMCLDGDTLYVADTENHAIRAVDLKAGTVATIAGIGTQSPRMHAIPYSRPAKETALSSPWDIIRIPGEKALFIAMAGPHQIWKLDLDTSTIGVFAGSGYENILDGRPDSAQFAQPSGLATDGRTCSSPTRRSRAFARSRGSRRRTLWCGLSWAPVSSSSEIVTARAPTSCSSIAWDWHMATATFTSRTRTTIKIKVCNPQTQEVKALVGSHEPGESDDPPRFYEPGGLSVAGTSLYVADTNNHKVRVVDLKTNTLKTLALAGVSPPRPAHRAPSFARARLISVPAVEAPAGPSIKFAVSIPLPKGEKLNEEVAMSYLVETPGKTGILAPEVPAEGDRIKPPMTEFQITVPLAKPAAAGDSLELRLSLQTFVCSETSSLCKIVNYRVECPDHLREAGSRRGHPAEHRHEVSREPDEEGDLPSGVHRTTRSEVLEHFSQGSVERRAVADRLDRIDRRAALTGHLARFFVFGSFVTDKVDPNDDLACRVSFHHPDQSMEPPADDSLTNRSPIGSVSPRAWPCWADSIPDTRAPAAWPSRRPRARSASRAL